MSLLRHKWFVRALLALVVGAVLVVYGEELLRWAEQLTQSRHAAKTPAVAPKPATRPLATVLPACRAKGPGFHACMFDAGYAVNPAWSDAHKAGAPTRDNPARQADAVNDRYREGASPAYGVPYWVTRDSLPPK